MNPRRFTSVAEQYHLTYLAQRLGLSQTAKFGIDLVGDMIGIELKSRLNLYTPNFAVHEYQVDHFRRELPAHDLFWAFMTYKLHDSIAVIKEQEIERQIHSRETWILPWDWIRQFPISPAKTGPYIYVHHKYFPNSEECVTIQEKESILHFPKGWGLDGRLLIREMDEVHKWVGDTI